MAEEIVMSAVHPFQESIEPEIEFSISETPLGGDRGVALEVRGELDIATAPLLRERLTAAIAQGHELVVVDLTPVVFLDSVTLAVLLSAEKSLAAGKRMALVVAPGSYARLIFDVTGVDRCVQVFATREQALQRPAA